MSGWTEVEVQSVKIIHHSTSSLIEILIRTDEEVEQGKVEKVTKKYWFDYDTFSDLREAISVLEKETSIDPVNLNDANSLLGRCLSCKHWVDDHYVLRRYSNRYKMCNIAKQENSNGFFDAICSSEDIEGELVTREDFGCILYEHM